MLQLSNPRLLASARAATRARRRAGDRTVQRVAGRPGGGWQHASRTRGRAGRTGPTGGAHWRACRCGRKPQAGSCCPRPPICPASTCGAVNCSARCWAAMPATVRMALLESDADAHRLDAARRERSAGQRTRGRPARHADRATAAARAKALPSAALSARHGGDIQTDPARRPASRCSRWCCSTCASKAGLDEGSESDWESAPGCASTPASRRWSLQAAQAAASRRAAAVQSAVLMP